MEWKEIYKNRFATVEEAVRAIEDGDRLVFGHAAGCPQVVPAERQNSSMAVPKTFL